MLEPETPERPFTKEDKEFARLLVLIFKDLNLFGYAESDDCDDDKTVENYRMLFTHHKEETPSLYLCRCSDDCTVLITACDFEKKEIEINTTEEWELCRKTMSYENGLPLESQSMEDGVAAYYASYFNA